jgi:hypothetical protein
VPTSITKNTYTRFSVTAQSTCRKSQAGIVSAWVRRNCRQLVCARCGAGGTRRIRSSRAIVARLTRCPSLRNSPWIRT